VLAVRQLNRRAGAADDQLPRVALEIDGRGALAGRARSGRAVILPLEGDAKTLFLMRGDGCLVFRLCQRRRESDRGEGARYSAGQDKRRNCGLRRHDFLQVNSSPPSGGRIGYSTPLQRRYSGLHQKVFALRVRFRPLRPHEASRTTNRHVHLTGKAASRLRPASGRPITPFQSRAIVTRESSRSRNTEVHFIEVLHVRLMERMVGAWFGRLANANWILALKGNADDGID
jgi:hypothetical protein